MTTVIYPFAFIIIYIFYDELSSSQATLIHFAVGAAGAIVLIKWHFEHRVAVGMSQFSGDIYCLGLATVDIKTNFLFFFIVAIVIIVRFYYEH